MNRIKNYKNKFKIIMLSLCTVFVPIIAFTTFATSCSSNTTEPTVNTDSTPDNGYNIDKKLKDEFYGWFNSLSNQNFDPNNFHCESEAQAIILYANYRGFFWNESLHKQQEPKDYILQNKVIRANDYLKMEDGLMKAVFPYNYKVYHGVEYHEIEFWNQLKDSINKNQDGSYSYDNCVGKEITSYGFFSTSISRTEALEYCDGYVFNDFSKPWGEGEYFLPLKEEVLFEINIPKGYVGAAYLADYEFAGKVNPDNQVLINRNCRFKINKVYKEKNNGKIVNVFELDLIH